MLVYFRKQTCYNAIMFGSGRIEESKFTSWYYGIDRRLLGCVLGLIFIGVLCVVSAGSVQALRKGFPWYHFLQHMLPFYGVGLVGLFISSMLNKRLLLGLSVADVAVCFVLLILTLVMPETHHGSDRWVRLLGVQVMPSDIMKPGFIMLTALFFAKMKEKFGDNIFTSREAWRFSALSWWAYLIPFGMVLGILFKQPDIGTMMLYFVAFVAFLFVAGLPRAIFLPVLGVLGSGGLLAFLFQPHVHRRVMDFFKPLDPTTQVGYSVSAIRQGGLFGMVDEAFAKESLPDAHTDFIYAAMVEDWGAIIACLILVFLLCVIRRLVTNAMSARDAFVFYAVSGTAALFGTQICINLATTLHMMPPKGMTLPFISSGGSSFLGYCLLFGMVLAIIREDKWK